MSLGCANEMIHGLVSIAKFRRVGSVDLQKWSTGYAAVDSLVFLSGEDKIKIFQKNPVRVVRKV